MRHIAFALLPVLGAPVVAEQGADKNIGPAVLSLGAKGTFGQIGWTGAGTMPWGGFLYEAQATADSALWTSVTAIVDVLDEAGATAKADLLDWEVLHGSWTEVSRPGSGLQFDDTQLVETLQGPRRNRRHLRETLTT